MSEVYISVCAYVLANQKYTITQAGVCQRLVYFHRNGHLVLEIFIRAQKFLHKFNFWQSPCLKGGFISESVCLCVEFPMKYKQTVYDEVALYS